MSKGADMFQSTSVARGTCWVTFGVLLSCSAATVYAAKDVFIRSKPHVNVGTVDGVEMLVWLHANVGIDETDGSASGVIQLRLETGEHLIYQAVAADGLDDGSFRLLVRPLRGGGQSDELDLVFIRPDTAIGDCLIYDFVGPNVTVDAPGTIAVKPRKDR